MEASKAKRWQGGVNEAAALPSLGARHRFKIQRCGYLRCIHVTPISRWGLNQEDNSLSVFDISCSKHPH